MVWLQQGIRKRKSHYVLLFTGALAITIRRSLSSERLFRPTHLSDTVGEPQNESLLYCYNSRSRTLTELIDFVR